MIIVKVENLFKTRKYGDRFSIDILVDGETVWHLDESAKKRIIFEIFRRVKNRDQKWRKFLWN